MPIDRTPFYANEQFASADQTSVQRMMERYLEDVAGYAQRSIGLGMVGNSPSNDGAQPSIALVGGLAAYNNVAGLEIGPGMILSTLVDSPDNPTLSGAYLCTNPTSTVVALPSPVSDTWTVICVRPALVDDAPLSRRVWNEALSRWDATNLVKRQRSKLIFDVVVSPFAGQLPFVYPANSVPIWAVLRPAGGGPVLDAHVIDLRPVRPVGGARGDGGYGASVQLGHSDWSFTAANQLQLNVHLTLENMDLHAVSTFAGLDPLLFQNPSDAAPADGEWWYLYLARFPYLGPLCAPRHAQLAADGLNQQGLVILSKVRPFLNYQLHRVNSGDLHAPDPFSSAVIGSGNAALFGALKRVGSSWAPCQGDGDRVSMLGLVSGTSHAATHSFTFDHGAPRGARAVTLEIDSTAAATVYEIDRPDGTVSLYYRNLPAAAEARTLVEVPLGPLGDSVTLRLQSTLNGDWTPKMRGYRI
jgi:hypothetical protein